MATDASLSRAVNLTDVKSDAMHSAADDDFIETEFTMMAARVE